jgi:hypothetical protein
MSPRRRRGRALDARTACPLQGDKTLAYYRTARLIPTIIFVAEPGGRAVYSIVFHAPDS